MRAMVLFESGQPLALKERPDPQPGPGQILIDVEVCGVCRTDLHVVDGELTEPKLPLILGHEIVGTVAGLGSGVDRFRIGDRVGVPWLGWTCDACDYCRRGQENLCLGAKFTGYTIDGGYADRTLVDERYCFAVPGGADAVSIAPLLCAGLIGYRSYRMAGLGRRLGFYGFGAAAHVIAQLAVHDGRELYAFTRPGDDEGQRFARSLGAVWAGPSDRAPPQPLDAAIIFAPIGPLVPAALEATDRGGTVVCAGIHMSDIPSFPYALLWQERSIRSVANLTRRDAEEFMDVVARVPIETQTHRYPLERANDALDDLRAGRFTGAAVLVP